MLVSVAGLLELECAMAGRAWSLALMAAVVLKCSWALFTSVHCDVIRISYTCGKSSPYTFRKQIKVLAFFGLQIGLYEKSSCFYDV